MRAAALAASLGVLSLLVGPRDSLATHFPDYVVDDLFWNPPPGTTLRGINAPWIIDGQPYNVCSDWNPLPPDILAALNDWEAVLPGIQFDYTCPGSTELWIYSGAVHGPTQYCQPGDVGCAWWIQGFDTVRGGSYTTGTTGSGEEETSSYVWVDTIGTEFQQNGLRYVVAHELGHIFGLDEKYYHEPENQDPPYTKIECGTTTAASIMDTARRLLDDFISPVIGGCDSYQPTAGDVDRAQQLYDHQPVQELSTAFLVSDTVLNFKDTNWAESHYVGAVYLYEDGELNLVDTLVDEMGGGAGTAGKGHYIRVPWDKPGTPYYPNGAYSLCIIPESAVYGGDPARQRCSNEALSADDTDGDGYLDVDEYYSPFCQKVSALDLDEDGDGKINDGCDNDGAAETGAQCDNDVNDDPWDDPLVNDGCPQYGDYSEAEFRITTLWYSGCSAYSWTWPADLSQGLGSMFRVNLLDLTSFLAPVRHYETSPPDPDYSMRWDVVPGRGYFADFINIQDLTSLQTVRPDMYPYYGTLAYNGPPCYP